MKQMMKCNYKGCKEIITLSKDDLKNKEMVDGIGWASFAVICDNHIQESPCKKCGYVGCKHQK